MEGRPAVDSLSGKERSCAPCSLEVGRHPRLTIGCESAERFSGLARCRPAECAEEGVRRKPVGSWVQDSCEEFHCCGGKGTGQSNWRGRWDTLWGFCFALCF